MFSGCFGPTRAHRQGQCVCIAGPCEWLLVNVFGLLWANSSSSARAVCSHCGPMRMVAGECFQAALGQLELIGKGSVVASRAHASGCSFGPTRAHRQWQCVCIAGPCEWLQVNVFRLLWANSSTSARAVCLHRGPVRGVGGGCFRAALGQLELIGKGSVFAPWAHASGCR